MPAVTYGVRGVTCSACVRQVQPALEAVPGVRSVQVDFGQASVDSDGALPFDRLRGKKQILNRLATIEGHLRAIQKMIEQDRCCRDILSQTYAVERALKAFEVALVDHHLVSRLPTDRAERSSEMLRELFEFAPLNETSTASAAWRTTVNARTPPPELSHRLRRLQTVLGKPHNAWLH